MDPTRDTHATLVDLLDRLLERGLMLDADLIIHIAGIPLLGVKLKAALAGMETMLKYGIWKEWDEAQRAIATEEQRRNQNQVPLMREEEILLKMFASQSYNNGIYHCWRSGCLYVTDRRVFLLRKEPAELLSQCYYDEIMAVATARENNSTGKQTDYLYLSLKAGEVAQLHPSDASLVKDTIEQRMKALGLEAEGSLYLSSISEIATKSLHEEVSI